MFEPLRATVARLLSDACERSALADIAIDAYIDPALSGLVAQTIAMCRSADITGRRGRLVFVCGQDSGLNSLVAEAIALKFSEELSARTPRDCEPASAILFKSFRRHARNTALRALADRTQSVAGRSSTTLTREHAMLLASCELESLQLLIDDSRDGGTATLIESMIPLGRCHSGDLFVIDGADQIDSGWVFGESSSARKGRTCGTLRTIAQVLDRTGLATIYIQKPESGSPDWKPSLEDFAAAGYVAEQDDLVIFAEVSHSESR